MVAGPTFGIGAEFWIYLQSRLDPKAARERDGGEIEREAKSLSLA